jgi:asparagine synthase (glutamine-hydrolysing)
MGGSSRVCGIAGILGAVDIKVSEPALGAALARLVHRGPDDEGTLVEPGLALGMRRLSIIDLEGGHQPLWNEDRTVAVFLNGEIYNYIELRSELESQGHTFSSRSDTEVIAHLYEERGDDLCSKLRGMFALCVWDRRRRLLLLARDRFGKKPLYWARGTKGVLVFASEIPALRVLLGVAGIPENIDRQGVYDYLSLGTVPQPGTIFAGVQSLEPSRVLVVEGESERERRYWTPQFEPKIAASYPEAMERIRAVLREAVRIRLRSDVPLGLFLSGGIDSAVVACEIAALGGHDVTAFTVSVPDRKLEEAPAAAMTAWHLGLPHVILPLELDPVRDLTDVVGRYGQPFADSSAIPSLRIARLARQDVTVALNGDGGDEVFGGYRRYAAARVFDYLPRRGGDSILKVVAKLTPGGSVRRSASGFLRRFRRGVDRTDADRYLIWTVDLFREEEKRTMWRGGEPVRPTERLCENTDSPVASEMDRLVALDLRLNLCPDLLVKMDIATMAASLEGRSPLLDHVLAELAFSLPSSFRVRRGRLKAILRDAYAKELPEEIVHAPKRGFEVPMERWLRTELRDLVESVLLSPTARVRDWLDPSVIAALWRRGPTPDENWAGKLYALLVLELWLRDLQVVTPTDRIGRQA